MRVLLCLAANLVIASMLMASQAAAQETRQETKAAKERSSRKWFDEQRVDNCRVPVELRGSMPRPGCAGEQASASVSR
jgi:Ni/Co efflux regulator RcnB